MGKFGRLFLNLIILAIMLPIIYYFTESYTAPVGHVSTGGTTYTTGGLFVSPTIMMPAILDENGVVVVAAHTHPNPYTIAPSSYVVGAETIQIIGGVNAETLALVGAIPWALPLFVLVYAIVDFVKPEQPKGM